MINRAFTNPKSITVVGASNHPDKPGGQLLLNLIQGGFQGHLYPVNPKEKFIHNIPCFNSLDDLPETDMAILAIPAAYCVDTVKKLAESKNTRAFIIASAGFSESGEEGKQYEIRLQELSRQYQLAIIGPNCIGVLNSKYKAVFISPYPELINGGVDFVSASGAFAVFVFELASMLGLRFGEVYSVGNSVDIGIEQILRFWDENYSEGTSGKVKLVYAEQIREPLSFYKHISSLRKKGCYVLVIKPGESDSGARAALSHTGSMAGDNEAIDYLIRKSGAVRCQSREELVYLANILSQKPLKGNRMAVITHAGGPAVLLCDHLQKNGFSIPELDKPSQKKLCAILQPGSSVTNPVDILATGSREQLAEVLDLYEKLENIDGSIVIYGKTGLDNLFDTFNLLHKKISGYTKPVYPVLPSIATAEKEISSFTNLGHPCYSDEVELAKSLGLAINIPEAFDTEIIPAPRSVDNHRTLPEKEVYNLLVSVGIPLVQTDFMQSLEEIERVAEQFNYPLVAKVMGILHKTEHGGIIKGINNRVALFSAFEKLMTIPAAKGIIIQEMLSGTELFIGGKMHPGVGYSVHAGMGGIFVELMDERVSTLATISQDEALYLIGKLKKQQFFEGFRNQAPVNREAFAKIISDFSMLFSKYPEILEIDLNPLIANEKGIFVVDARIIIGTP